MCYSCQLHCNRRPLLPERTSTGAASTGAASRTFHHVPNGVAQHAWLHSCTRCMPCAYCWYGMWAFAQSVLFSPCPACRQLCFVLLCPCPCPCPMVQCLRAAAAGPGTQRAAQRLRAEAYPAGACKRWLVKRSYLEEGAIGSLADSWTGVFRSTRGVYSWAAFYSCRNSTFRCRCVAATPLSTTT